MPTDLEYALMAGNAYESTVPLTDKIRLQAAVASIGFHLIVKRCPAVLRPSPLKMAMRLS